jgi:hypothetical protein
LSHERLSNKDPSYRQHKKSDRDGLPIGALGIRVLNTLKTGRESGAFSFLHVAAMDSIGNFHAGEVATGRRIQKFSPAAR